MSASGFRKRVKNFGRRVLAERGFDQASTWSFEKPLPGLRHGLGFVVGSGAWEGLFNLDVYWRFTHSNLVFADAMDFCRRVGYFQSGQDEWFPIDDEASLQRLAVIYAQSVDPFLKEHESIEAILRDYEEGRYGPQLLFGTDAGWQAYNIGFCYLWVGRTDKALPFLLEVIEKHSADPYDWVHRRKSATLDAIQALEGGGGIRG